jgi:hypothetical protein
MDAPTLSMSNTPQPRRIERRKIIACALRQGRNDFGAQLKAALGPTLQYGKYDVFHRLDRMALRFSVSRAWSSRHVQLGKNAARKLSGHHDVRPAARTRRRDAGLQ